MQELGSLAEVFPGPGNFQQVSRRPDIGRRYPHMRPEYPGLNPKSIVFKGLPDFLKKDDGLLRSQGRGEGRPVTLTQVRRQGELGDEQDTSPSRPKVQVGLPLLVLEDPELPQALRHLVRRLQVIPLGTTEVDQETLPDPSDDLLRDHDLRLVDPLHQGLHGASSRLNQSSAWTTRER